MSLIVLAVSMLSLLLGTGFKTQPEPNATALADNAALIYWQYWAAISPEQREHIPDPAKEGEEWMPGEADTPLLKELQRAVDGIVTTAAMQKCNFGVRQMPWPQAASNHLPIVRLSYRLLAADARRCESEHDVDRAIGRVEAMYQMAGHVADDGWEIHRLVGLAALDAAMRETERMLARVDLSRPQIKRLHDIVAKVPSPDVLAGVRLELEDFAAWARKRPKVSLRELIGSEPGTVDITVDGSVAADDMMKLLRLYEEAWGQADAGERLEAITKDAGSEKLGMVPSLIMPNATDGFRFEQQAKARLEKLRKDLAARVTANEQPATK